VWAGVPSACVCMGGPGHGHGHGSRVLTGCLEVESSQLHGVGGVVQGHLLAVGQASFPRFGFRPFPAIEQQLISYLSYLKEKSDC